MTSDFDAAMLFIVGVVVGVVGLFLFLGWLAGGC